MDTMILMVKNMVCDRCISTVGHIFSDLGIPINHVSLGEIHLKKALTKEQIQAVESRLKKVGFELIEKRVNQVVEEIKKLIIKYISLGMEMEHIKLSSYITKHLSYEYSYLSDMFSSIEGKTIEQFFILQRIEKVKELLVYDQLSLTEISYQTGFSSVHHLSAQFKKVTGLTPSHFKKIGAQKRKTLDSL
jgi:AraC-like DNA-binding protein